MMPITTRQDSTRQWVCPGCGTCAHYHEDNVGMDDFERFLLKHEEECQGPHLADSDPGLWARIEEDILRFASGRDMWPEDALEREGVES